MKEQQANDRWGVTVLPIVGNGDQSYSNPKSHVMVLYYGTMHRKCKAK